MGQVPSDKSKSVYTLVGSGRLARHLSHYFQLIGQTFNQWSRNRDPQFNTLDIPDNQTRLAETVQSSTHVLLLISDGAIEDFVRQNPSLSGKTLVHFSGALSLDGIDSAHPLMTFGPDLYDIETYQQIPFVTEQGKHSFHQIFPFLPNLSYRISPEQKARYHSLCVASGNFTTLLWTQVMKQMSEQVGLPQEVLLPYMQQIFSNLLNNPSAALTGPLARKDMTTIEKNLTALEGDPLQDVYKAFVALAGIDLPQLDKQAMQEKLRDLIKVSLPQ